ncbi:MAG: hypothetical protein ACREEB_08755 [Caulobacteraceae bacterium]
MAWDTLRTIVKDGGDRRLVVLGNDLGLFTFTVEQFLDPSEEPGLLEGCWTPTSGGGYYQSADEAERDARQEIDWLRQSPDLGT